MTSNLSPQTVPLSTAQARNLDSFLAHPTEDQYGNPVGAAFRLHPESDLFSVTTMSEPLSSFTWKCSNDVQTGLPASTLALLSYSQVYSQHSSQNDVFKHKPDHVIPVMTREEFDIVTAGHMVYQPVVIARRQSWVACCWGH